MGTIHNENQFGELPFGELSMNTQPKSEIRRRRKKKTGRLPQINHRPQRDPTDMIENFHSMMNEQSDRPWRDSMPRSRLPKNSRSKPQIGVAGDNLTSTDGHSWKRELQKKRKESERQFYI